MRELSTDGSRTGGHPGDCSPEPSGGRSHGHLQLEGKWEQQWVLDHGTEQGREDYPSFCSCQDFQGHRGAKQGSGAGDGGRWRLTRAPLAWGNL